MPSENIYAQFAQPLRSVQDYANEYDQQDLNRLRLEGEQRKNMLAGLLAQQQQQSMADGQRSQNIIRRVFSGLAPDAAPDARIAALRRTGDRAAIEMADAQEAAWLKRRQTESEVGAKDVETENKVIATYRDLVGGAMNPQQAAQYVQIMHSDPRLKNTAIARVPLDQALAQIGNDPQTFGQWKQQFALGAAKFVEQNKPQYITQNLGGTSRITAVPGLGVGPAVTASEATITQSADNAATVGAQYANAAAAREQARATRDAARITARAGDETSLRKEFADLPEVKKYKNAIPAYQAVVKAAQTNNPQADINLIYGLAKLYDPDSVVREGEYDTIANSQSIPEWLKGQAQRLAGGGKLTQATKNQIIEQADIRIGAYKSEVDGARQSYEGITQRRGLDPGNVFPEIGGQVQGGGLTAAEKAELEQLRKQFGRK